MLKKLLLSDYYSTVHGVCEKFNFYVSNVKNSWFSIVRHELFTSGPLECFRMIKVFGVVVWTTCNSNEMKCNNSYLYICVCRLNCIISKYNWNHRNNKLNIIIIGKTICASYFPYIHTENEKSKKQRNAENVLQSICV